MASGQDDDVKPELSSDFMRVVAESQEGLTNLSESACKQLAAEVTYRCKELVQEAKKFTIHGKRRVMSTGDVDRSLRVMNLEPLYGFVSKQEIPFRMTSGGGRDIYFLEEKELELASIINSPVPKAPLDFHMKAHWLVVDGVQPAIPENPVESREEKAGGEEGAKGEGGRNKRRRLRQSEVVQVKSTLTHDLSLEQQMYFKEVTEACVGSDETKRTEALTSLSTDTGIQTVLPRFVVFISEGVRCNVIQHNLALLIYLMRMMKSLTDNPAVNLEKSLHELIPAVFTCILSRQLCARPDVDNHWALRDFASRLLVAFARSYENQVAGLQMRMTEVLGTVLNGKSPFPMLYGAVGAIGEFGTEAIKNFLLPKVHFLADKCRQSIESSNPLGGVEKTSAEHLQKSLVKVLTNYVKTSKPPDLVDLQDYRNEFGKVGGIVYDNIVQKSAGRMASVSSSGSGHQQTTQSRYTVHSSPAPGSRPGSNASASSASGARILVKSGSQLSPDLPHVGKQNISGTQSSAVLLPTRAIRIGDPRSRSNSPGSLGPSSPASSNSRDGHT